MRIHRQLVRAIIVASVLAPPCLAAEPTSESLWRQQPPPFRAYAEGVAAPGQANAAREMRLGVLPWLLPPNDPSAARLAALEHAASHVAVRYAGIGLRAPRITRRDGAYPIYFVRDLGGAAAQYGPGFGEIGMSQALRLAEDDWDRVMIVGEAGGFGADLGIFPEKVAASTAHELFHGVQASYAHWSGHDNSRAHEEKWVTEALPEAVSMWSIEGLAFLGNPPFDPRQRFASGNQRFGKALGMRPYDYPLDLRAVPPRMRIYPQGQEPEKVREMASYMTSSFWRYAWETSMPRGQEWRPLPRALLLRTPRRGTASVAQDAVAWADRSLRENHPAWIRGLHDALPAFVPWWVAWPDEVMRSRRGEFAHARWLDHVFADGCPLYELDANQPTATFRVAIRELAAACVRVKWNGAPVGRSGWPAAALVVAPHDGGGEQALRDLHLGMHGTRLGKSEPFMDPKTSLPTLAWSGLTLDPRHPAGTDGETVITFTNVAPDPLATQRRTYEVHLGMATASASGQLSKPPEADGTPASRVKVAPRRHVQPGQVGPVPAGKAQVLQATPSPVADVDDCSNATAKSAGLVALGTDKARPASSPGAGLMAICLELATGMTREKLNPPLQPEVELKLPSVPDGHVGPIAGGEVHASWNDPGLGDPGRQHVSGRSRNVSLDIEEANPAFVRGRFIARFSARSDDLDGELRGDFVAWRAPTEQRLPLADAIDHASSDLVLAFAAMGRSPEDLRERYGRREDTAPSGPAASGGGTDQGCPMDCESLRAGRASPACRRLLASLYDACPAEGASSRAEVEELAAWLFRTMPEPMRSEMTRDTVETVMDMPGTIREDWVRKLRAQRDQAL